MRKPNTQDHPKPRAFPAGDPVDLKALARSIGVEIPTPLPWGYFATVGWLVLAILVGSILFIAVVKWLDPEAPFKPGVADDELRLLPYAMVSAGAMLAVLALAARLRHWRVKDYFGLVWPSKREVAIALAFLIVLSAVEGAVNYLTGWSTDYDTNLYVTARAGGLLPLLWLIISVIFVAPIAEEAIFRGFLYRGWVKTPRAVVPGIIVISALFALCHVQYDWFGIFMVFSFGGLFFGWVRWWSGSTLLAGLTHAVGNLWAMIAVVMNAEGFS
jgi:membrane protease YdiL (CAAX protease family)